MEGKRIEPPQHFDADMEDVWTDLRSDVGDEGDDRAGYMEIECPDYGRIHHIFLEFRNGMYNDYNAPQEEMRCECGTKFHFFK